MLVEDNQTDRFVIQEVLKECGFEYRLQIAVNGQDALNFLGKVTRDESAPCPGLVLLDLNLPGILGLEVLKQIRKGKRCSHIPVIVVSSSESEEDRGAAREFGADAYFRKQVSLAAYLQLSSVICQLLKPGNKPD